MQKIKKLIIIIVMAVALVVCLLWTYRVLSWKDTSGSSLSSLTQLYNTDRDLMDVVFVGSSHCYCGIYPPYFWEDAGIAAFDLSVSGQDRNSALRHLRELLKTQSPTIVFFDVYGITYSEQLVIANEYRNMLSMRLNPNSAALVTEAATKDKWLDYWFRFPIIHGRYKELKKTDFVSYAPNQFGRGEVVNFRCNEYGTGELVDLDVFEPATLSPEQEKWLDDLVKLSEKKGFTLVFYSAPFYISREAQDQMDAVAVYAEEAGIPMLDFNRMREELGFDFHYDLQDPEHLNANGARKMANYFEEWLSENVSLPDRRGDERYAQWDLDLEWYYHVLAKDELDHATDPVDYARILAKEKDFKVIISLEGTDYASVAEVDYVSVLAEFGIPGDAGGKWLFEDGKLTKIMDNRLDAEPCYVRLNDTETMRIQYQGDYVFPENIMIGRQSYSHNGRRLAIIVYDELLEKVVHCAYF
ncbi:MAG: hypothetical protein IKH28_09330 [Lachnospiraceae bacterium]|nr:hypothetical protein [Lachnospiraceae bacterium]